MKQFEHYLNIIQNENLLMAQGAINPDRKQIFKTTTFGPAFQSELYAELKRVLPHGSQFDIKKWGNRNFLIITNVEGQEFKFPLGEVTSVYKVKNMIKQKITLNEKIKINGYNDLVDIWNEYIKLVDIIDGIISENGELSDSYWQTGVEQNIITDISTVQQIFDRQDEIIKNFNDLYDGLQGWISAGHNISRYGNINKINKKLITTEAMNWKDEENLIHTIWNNMTPQERELRFNITPEQSTKTWIGNNGLNYMEREEILQQIGVKDEIKDEITVESHNDNSDNYILEPIVDGFLAPYIKDNMEYTLDSDGDTVMLYIPANNVNFDITNIESVKFKFIQTAFDEFCKANDLYDGDVSTTDTNELVLSADTDIIDVRNPGRGFIEDDEEDQNKYSKEDRYKDTYGERDEMVTSIDKFKSILESEENKEPGIIKKTINKVKDTGKKVIKKAKKIYKQANEYPLLPTKDEMYDENENNKNNK